MEPLRIVSLLSSATEMLYALGLGEWVLAVSHECDWPPAAVLKPRATCSLIDSTKSSQAIDDEVKQRLAAGQPLYGINRDLIAKLRPNLIVTQAQCDVCAVRFDDVQALLQSQPALAGCRLISLQPNCLEDVLRDVERLGEAAGCRPMAEAYVASLRARVESVRQRAAAQVKDVGGPLRVAIIEWTEPLMLAANWTPELVTLAGGQCPLAMAGQPSSYCAWSDIAAWDPDAIVVAPCGFELERALKESKPLRQLPGWDDTSAARARRVFAMDGNAYLNRSGPRLVDTLEVLHELFWSDQPAVGRQGIVARF